MDGDFYKVVQGGPSSSPAKSRREAPPSPPVPNPVIDKRPSRRAEPDEQLQFQGGELR